MIDRGGRVYIKASDVDRVTDFVVEDLKRGQIPGPIRAAAFDALLQTYRGELRSLAAMGSGFERVSTVDDLRHRLAAA